MKVFSVIGTSKTGKTTTIEYVIRELRKRRYTVGSVKEIHYENFAIDTEGTNTDRHRKAGSQLVTARGLKETDILFEDKLKIDEILKFYKHEYVVLEGVKDINVPRIITAKNVSEIEELLDDRVFAIAGKVSNDLTSYKGVPVINATNDICKLVDLIEEKVFERLGEFSEKCCGECGMSCEELCGEIIQGRSTRKDCVLSMDNIKLKIDNEEIKMVPFVQNLLRNAVLAVVSELEGYEDGSKIQVQLGDDMNE